MDYIEFIKKENLCVKIHYNNKVRLITNKKNIEKLISICEKYGYERIDSSCYLEDFIKEIIRDYEKYYQRKKNSLKIYNLVYDGVNLIRNHPKISKTIMAMGTLTALAVVNPFGGKDIESPAIEYEVSNESINIKKESSNIIEKTSDNTTKEEIDTMLNEDVSEFNFTYDNKNIDNLQRVKEYQDIFIKYANMYGLDYNLLMAIASQESGGYHYDLLNTPAIGMMQIERSAFINREITAYNHEDGKDETFLVTDLALNDLESNIKIGAMLLQIALEASDYNIPLGVQTYNFGTGYINDALNMCASLTGVPKEKMKNNMEELEWLDYREFLNVGDPKYVEHVFSFLPNNEKITVKNRAGQEISLRVCNEIEKMRNI